MLGVQEPKVFVELILELDLFAFAVLFEHHLVGVVVSLVLFFEDGFLFDFHRARVEFDFVELLYDFEVLWVFVAMLRFESGLFVFEKVPQATNALVEVVFKIEAVLFSQPQLIVVVVETLFRQTDYFGGLL